MTIHALLLPLYGPVLDHHFAEWLPYHSHLYVAGEADHVHWHNIPHSHAHEADASGQLAETAGAVSIPAHELASQNVLLLSLFLGVLAAGIGRPLLIQQFIGLVERVLTPVHAVFLPLLDQPPRIGS